MTPSAGAFSQIEKLDATHDTDEFDCGKEPLNRFLKRFALANQRAESARTYVVCVGPEGESGTTASPSVQSNTPEFPPGSAEVWPGIRFP